LIFEQIKVTGSDNFSYLIGDENSGEAIVVDAPSPIEPILAAVKKHKLKVRYIVNTHGHRDHTSGNLELAKATGAKIAAHASAKHQKDVSLKDQDTLTIGSIQITVLHTPGHSPDSICVKFDKKLLTGDTLFVGECGRTDISGGDTTQLYDSLFNKIARLEDDFEVYPGHDYGKKPSSTIGLEKKTNYTLEPRSLKEFIEFMSEP
jgi:hydroxyacylglutathione hydrolase